MPVKLCCAPVPLKLLVPLFVIVPLLVIFPAIFNVPAADVISVAPAFTVKFLQLAVPLIIGILATPAAMVTSFKADGKIPEHQLFASAQSVLIAPVHCPVLLVDFKFVYAVAVQPAAVTCNV